MLPRLTNSAFLVITLASLGTHSLVAQAGHITYTHTVKIELPPEMAQMREALPQAREVIFDLHFESTASVMSRVRREGDGQGRAQQRRGRGGGDRVFTDRGTAMRGDQVMVEMMRSARGQMNAGFSIARMGPAERTYVSYEDGEMVETREFMGRTFRISSPLAQPDWRLTTEQAMHLDHMVVKAVAESDSTTIEAWFAPAIPVQGGPSSYGGLPGMILVLSINDGQTQYFATEIELGEVAQELISPPEDGQEVSVEEFEQIVEEKTEELRQMRRVRGPGR